MENARSSASQWNKAVPVVVYAEKKAVAWFREYTSPENVDKLDIDFFGLVIAKLNMFGRGLAGASDWLGWHVNSISVKLHAAKHKPTVAERYICFINSFPYDTMAGFFENFTDEHFDRAYTIAQLINNRRKSGEKKALHK